ncbi:unnamed protein product [Paramecium octaurelia]|uniref:KN homeodomain domain-containing protein n=1 Tax=Paramecium octaurelia TaxID=43137 RepID=A0A8S1SC97_PAROT|nr:unnamed protein product [Paramecium octaurelia]
MSLSLSIHAEQRKQFVCQQVNELQALFHKWINSNNLNEDMHQVLENEVKLYQQHLIIKDQNQLQEKKSRQFSKLSNINLKDWLYKHFSYPSPTKEQTIQLSEKSNLTCKQVFLRIQQLDLNLVYQFKSQNKQQNL